MSSADFHLDLRPVTAAVVHGGSFPTRGTVCTVTIFEGVFRTIYKNSKTQLLKKTFLSCPSISTFSSPCPWSGARCCTCIHVCPTETGGTHVEKAACRVCGCTEQRITPNNARSRAVIVFGDSERGWDSGEVGSHQF